MFGNFLNETPYDLRWRMFGIPVRVQPTFWLMAAVISWGYNRLGLLCVAIAVACIFVSILVHELGHVVAGLWFGARGRIVLWTFGGVAIGSNQSDKRWQRIVVSAAGPFAQFLLFGLVLLALPHVPLVEIGFAIREDFLPDRYGPFSPEMYTLFASMLFINLYWPLLNLLPIWPLDGGQISRELFTAASRYNGVRLSLHVSMGLSILLAAHALYVRSGREGIPYLPVGVPSAIFFGLFALMSWQALQIENERERWSSSPWD